MEVMTIHDLVFCTLVADQMDGGDHGSGMEVSGSAVSVTLRSPGFDSDEVRQEVGLFSAAMQWPRLRRLERQGPTG